MDSRPSKFNRNSLLEPDPVTLSVIVDPEIDGGPPLSEIFSLLEIIVASTLLLFLLAPCFLLVDFAVVILVVPWPELVSRCHSFIGGLEFAERILIDGCLFVELDSVWNVFV